MQAQNIIKTGASKPDDLVKLLSALQASLLFWCKKILGSSSGEKAKKAASSLLSDCESFTSSMVLQVFHCRVLL